MEEIRMKDSVHKKTISPARRSRTAAKKSTPMPAGDYTSIRVPIPQPSSFNRDRPISDLIKAQLLHIAHAESARLPREQRDGRKPEDIRTEAEAASYIAAVTRVLHPQGQKKPS
jgi:hypothetical protein